ncbi:MAG TPA: mechanosensitive ion channel domain-containing protein [Rhodanobacteraceae bacterium]|nr:mechanosensitive ion channel domain-containing protein [Rhodanobacteraceae bacterium]
MAAPLANQLQDTKADTLETLRAGVQRANQFLDVPLINSSGVKLTVGELLAAILVLLIALLASWLLRAILSRYARRHPTNQSALYTLSRIVHYILLITGVLLALSVAGIPLSKFALFAGALGVGLGFGLQAIFSNFISGLIILFDRSLKVGDFVELANGVHGEVRDIHIRATRVTTNDNIDILVPNSEFVTHNVVNWTLREVARRQRIPFQVAQNTDKELVKKAALEAAASVPFTLAQDGPRRPQVWLTGFGDFTLNFALVVWLNADAVKHPSSVAAAYNWALHNAFLKYNIELPFPQRDLHVRSWFGLSGEDARRAVTESRHPSRSSTPSKREAEPAVAHHERERLAENDAARNVEHRIEEDRARAAKQGYREENATRASVDENTTDGDAIESVVDDETGPR